MAPAPKGETMALHRPPSNDLERLENLIEGLVRLDEDARTVDDVRTEAEAAGIDLAAWAARIKAKARHTGQAGQSVSRTPDAGV